MKRNVRKKILLLTVCTLIVGALLLTGCRPTNEIDDPWLDTWQAVVVDRSVEVEKVEVIARYTVYSSQMSPQPQVTESKDDIERLLAALFAPVASFNVISSEGISTLHGYYQLNFYISGADEIFGVQIISGNIIYFLNDTECLQCTAIKDSEALKNISNTILGINSLG